MPNPNRPQYQDTIESTWGQAVADTVVRRYDTPAARDADLAGFTPAQLAGQLVTVHGDVMEYVSGVWVTLRAVVVGYLVVTTDANGNFQVPNMPAGSLWYGAVGNGADSVFPAYLVLNPVSGAPGTNKCMFTVRGTTNNAVVANASVKVSVAVFLYWA